MSVLVLGVWWSWAFVPAAHADTVFLKNGRELEGVITFEGQDYIEMAIDIGKVKFYQGQIDRIVRSSAESNESMEEAWKREKERKAAELKRLKEEEQRSKRIIEGQRRGDHLLVEAMLNNKVSAQLMIDTGASNVMLSLRKARELGLEIRDDVPDAKMKLADGSDVPVKIFTLQTINIKGAQARNVQIAVPFDDAVLTDFDGLLGMSYLKLFRFEIDLKKNKLVLQRPESS